MNQQPLLEIDPAVRRAFDYYPTPAWMTLALLDRAKPVNVLEPCAGELAIAKVLKAHYEPVGWVESNDLNPAMPTDTHCDAATPEYWAAIDKRTHNRPVWGVTNVPFNLADAIVPLAVRTLPYFATILRLSWLEPAERRGDFLRSYPPKQIIVMPRHDFNGRGQTDSVTSAWFVWGLYPMTAISIVTKAERDALIAEARRVQAPQAADAVDPHAGDLGNAGHAR